MGRGLRFFVAGIEALGSKHATKLDERIAMRCARSSVFLSKVFSSCASHLKEHPAVAEVRNEDKNPEKCEALRAVLRDARDLVWVFISHVRVGPCGPRSAVFSRGRNATKIHTAVPALLLVPIFTGWYKGLMGQSLELRILSAEIFGVPKNPTHF